MKKLLTWILIFLPLFGFSQSQVGPNGDVLLIGLLILLLVPLVFYFGFRLWNKKRGKEPIKNNSFRWRKLKISLKKDRKYRPQVLTLEIQNVSNKDVDIEAPVLCFQKIWTKRKFKLKGINRYEIYPLYLEKGKTHELRIDLSVFYQHDRKLRKFYWGKIHLFDATGRKYSSKYVTLRKSLFS